MPPVSLLSELVLFKPYMTSAGYYHTCNKLLEIMETEKKAAYRNKVKIHNTAKKRILLERSSLKYLVAYLKRGGTTS